MTSVEEVISLQIGGSPRGELLLEILSEEIPARMQQKAIGDFAYFLSGNLSAVEIPAENILSYVTPRRLVLIAEGIPAIQPARIEERRGPRVGAPQAAINGFLRSVKLASVEKCEIRDTGRGAFYFARVERPGAHTLEVLPGLVRITLDTLILTWPKTMRFPSASFRWVRPITSVICLFDGNVVPLDLDEIPVGRQTRGHRFLSPGAFCADSADEYREKLQHAYVIIDQDERRELIRADLDLRAAELGLKVKPDPGLLEEVTGLAEFPVVLAGAIDPNFMTLPPEVLQTAMRTHQKYFSCAYPDGRPAPHFLFVANNLAEDGGAAIVAGNERVLRARLADARFFWDQDRKAPLVSRVETLKERIYHEKLGSTFDKAERLAGIAHSLAPIVGANASFAHRAAILAKADLSTGMVGEFPELQGIMGSCYARQDGEDSRVAQAIADHYKPQGPNDTCPTAPESRAVALADKIDTLVSFFTIGERPTGSRDPFALRRAGLGIIRLVLENRLRLGLRHVFHDAWKMANIEGADPSSDLVEFIADRLKVHFRDQGVRHDLIAAAFVHTAGIPEQLHFEDDLVRLVNRVRALESFLATDDGANLLIAYRRAANIVAIEEKKDRRSYDRVPDLTSGMLRRPEEIALDRALRKVLTAPEFQGENFSAAMALLATLRQPVDAFFDKVTVNTDETVTLGGQQMSLRENRLCFLSMIRDTMNRVADFSKIEG